MEVLSLVAFGILPSPSFSLACTTAVALYLLSWPFGLLVHGTHCVPIPSLGGTPRGEQQVVTRRRQPLVPEVAGVPSPGPEILFTQLPVAAHATMLLYRMVPPGWIWKAHDPHDQESLSSQRRRVC